MAAPDSNTLIRAIVPLNNRYRAEGPTRGKLEALWELGDHLHRAGVAQPHRVGWQIQRETKGLIKRPTVFRAFKIRSIFPTKQALLTDLRGLKYLSNFIEMLPLIDPAQPVRARLSESALADLYRHARDDSPSAFKRFLVSAKSGYSHGRLGIRLDRARHLNELSSLVRDFEGARVQLLLAMQRADRTPRDAFRRSIGEADRLGLANMCISLTTKDNFRLYRRLGPPVPTTDVQVFAAVYSRFRSALDKTSDTDRARIRRLIAPEALAQMADLLSSVRTEASVRDYLARMKLSLNLPLRT
jgi:hypothetical protein